MNVNVKNAWFCDADLTCHNLNSFVIEEDKLQKNSRFKCTDWECKLHLGSVVPSISAPSLEASALSVHLPKKIVPCCAV